MGENVIQRKIFEPKCYHVGVSDTMRIIGKEEVSA